MADDRLALGRDLVKVEYGEIDGSTDQVRSVRLSTAGDRARLRSAVPEWAHTAQ